MTSSRLLAALTAALVLLPAVAGAADPTVAPGAPPQVAPAVFVEPGTTITVAAGQTFLVAIPSNATTGYSWDVIGAPSPEVATVVGVTYLAPQAQRAGAGGTTLVLFRATAAGTTKATLGYRRAWEKTKPAKRAVFSIVVK